MGTFLAKRAGRRPSIRLLKWPILNLNLATGMARELHAPQIIEVIIMDTEIRVDVESELFCCDRLKSAEIAVLVQDGVVTLSGIVEKYEDELAAIRAAERVAGVEAVACELAVKSRDPLERCDTDLARDAACALALNTAVPRHRVRIEVSRGWIRLKGTVDTVSQKNAAAGAVSSTIVGAIGMVNLIDVKPLVPPVDL